MQSTEQVIPKNKQEMLLGNNQYLKYCSIISNVTPNTLKTLELKMQNFYNSFGMIFFLFNFLSLMKMITVLTIMNTEPINVEYSGTSLNKK